MRGTASWVGKVGAVAFALAGMLACADAPTGTVAPKGPARMIACDTSDGCGGGADYSTSPAPNNDVKLMAFEDQPGYPTNEYYELRHRYIVNGAEVYYNAQWWHGNSSAIGDLAGADLGRPYPCMGFIRVQIYRNNVYFGHVVSSYFIGSVDIQPNQNGVPVGYMDVSWGVQGYVRYAWNGCQ